MSCPHANLMSLEHQGSSSGLSFPRLLSWNGMSYKFLALAPWFECEMLLWGVGGRVMEVLCLNSWASADNAVLEGHGTFGKRRLTGVSVILGVDLDLLQSGTTSCPHCFLFHQERRSKKCQLHLPATMKLSATMFFFFPFLQDG